MKLAESKEQTVITSGAATHQDLNKVQTTVLENVATHVGKKTVVVYNPFSLEAVLAASVLKTHRPNFEVVSAAQSFAHDAAAYIWVGVTNFEDLNRQYKLKKAVHESYNTNDPVSVDDTGYRAGLIERVCVDHDVRFGHRQLKLQHNAQRFYLPDQKVTELAYTYGELKKAVAILAGQDFSVFTTGGSVDEYMAEVHSVKAMLRGGYSRQPALAGGHIHRAIFTNFSDHRFIVALRLIKLAHENFVNHDTGMNGDMIYSNLSDLSLEEDRKSIPVILN